MEPDDTHWRKEVELVQAKYRNVNLAKEGMWNTVVLILKGGGRYFRGIGLVEILWKTATVIINWRFASAIGYHNTLHGFREGRGTGTSNLDTKLTQQLTARM